MTDCGRHTFRGWMDKHAGSRAWLEASSGYDEAVFDLIGRLERGGACEIR